MKFMLTVSVLAALAAVPVVQADCEAPPESVQVPDGNTATRDEMVAAQKAVKAYDEAVKVYTDCLQQEEATKVAAGGDKVKLHNQYAKLNNAEVQKVQEVADKFNTELRAYKAKNSPPAS
jgi:outer membrane protein assembly factor BamD (BamD/ComL family)